MTRVLITGGFGFIGSSLAQRCLSLGHQVTLLSRSTHKINNADGLPCQRVIKDVCDLNREDIQNYDWLFHCASTVDNYNIKTNPSIDIRTNCNGTISVLECCRMFNPNIRIVFPSTFFVNGNLGLDRLPATSYSPCSPRGLYGATKLAAEHFCKAYHNVFGLNVVIARLVNIFGPGEQRNNNKKAAFNRMINLAVQGKQIDLYGGEFARDILYIDDAVDGLMTLMQQGLPGKVYYVGSGQWIRVRSFVEMVVEEACAGVIVDVDTPEFHLATGIEDFWCDPSPLESLGWKQRISLREGIRRTIKSYRSGNG